MMNNIVLVWVGGAWVSAIARLFLWCWYKNIIGIDSSNSELTKQLQEEGLSIKIWHGNYSIDAHDIVIYSSAATESPEVIEARRLFNTHESIRPPFSYFEFLWEISKYFTTIAVAWTHGKSTTTALTASTLATCSPLFWLGIVGAWLSDRWGKNSKISDIHHKDISDILDYLINPKAKKIDHLAKKYLFVIEACEYNYQFLSLDVDYAIITNIELDHADVYWTFENYVDTFIKFWLRVRKKIISLQGTKGISEIAKHVRVPIELIPIKKFNFTHLLWTHNHANASLALEICWQLSSSESEILHEKIESFSWLWRRWELLGETNLGVTIISDYAHHPTELESTILAIKEKYDGQDITLVFQPHQARRVVEFWDEFITSLQWIENPIIYNIYTARESVSDIEWYNIQSKYLQSEVQDIRSFDDLWNLFVDQFNGNYITNFEDIKLLIATKKEWVILICTAWNLDREIRKFLLW